MRSHPKDIFIIHTRSSPLHRGLVPSVSTLLETLGLRVWQYSDWTWTTATGSQEIDRDTLRAMLTTTPGVIAFDVSEDGLTPGMREEARIIDDDFDRLFPLGRFALVSATDHGFFRQRYPLRLGPTLKLEEGVEASEQVVERICLFGLRVIVRQSMLRQVLLDPQPERSAITLDEWAVISVKLIGHSPHSLRDESDVEIPRLTEELLLWFGSLSRVIGIERLRSHSPKLCEWISDEFTGFLDHDRLSEYGLASLVDAVETLGAPGVPFLERIRSAPMCWDQTDPDEREFSDEALRKSTQILARHYGRSAFDFAREVPPEVDDVEKELEILAELAHTEHERNEACKHLLAQYRSESANVEVAAACVGALGKVGNQGTATCLATLALNDDRVEVRLAAMLSLIEIRGPDAQLVVDEFVRRADSRSRIIVASVAWRINLDSTYELLSSLESDATMRANIQYSLVRAHHPRAPEQVLSDLLSDSSYLQAVAAGSALDLLDQLDVPHPFRASVVPLLESAVEEGDEELHMVAVISLIRASQSKYCSQAAEILENSLSNGNVSLARSVIVNASLGILDWPNDRSVRALLYHSDPTVRGATCYLVGRQTRSAFVDQLRILENDPSRVLREPYEDGALMGATVGQCAHTALERLQ